MKTGGFLGVLSVVRREDGRERMSKRGNVGGTPVR